MTSRVENSTDLILEKIFEAPLEKVFEMFTNSDQLKEFWAPRGWELIHSNMDFRPGGEWYYGMKSTDEKQPTFGIESWGKIVYQEIEAPKRIVYYDYFADEKGEINREMPVAETTIEFAILDEDRTFVVSRTRYNTAEELQYLMDNGLLEGIAETWDRLTDYLGYRRI